MATVKAFPLSANKALPFSANLVKLLPTGTVFAFQSVLPSFSNNGRCEIANRYLTLSAIILCSLACFLSSFTDTFMGNDNKLYYGIATVNGLLVFNNERGDGLDSENDREEVEKLLRKYRLTAIDFVHAFCSLTLFLVIACSSFDVQRCFFPRPGRNGDALMKNLPLAAGILASGLFMIFPTKRRGIGYGDKLDSGDKREEKPIEKIAHKEEHHTDMK